MVLLGIHEDSEGVSALDRREFALLGFVDQVEEFPIVDLGVFAVNVVYLRAVTVHAFLVSFLCGHNPNTNHAQLSLLHFNLEIIHACVGYRLL